MNEVGFVIANPVSVLTDAAKYSEFYRHVKAECDAFVPDLSTVTSRAKIASQAHKVTRTKTAIDAAGKKLNEEARSQINVVDAARRKIRDELDALADEVRKPLTEWEDAEAKRKEASGAMLERIMHLSSLIHGPSDQIRADLAELEGIVIDSDIHGDADTSLIKAIADGVGGLKVALDRALQSEADARELAKLRAEAEARERAERERLAEEAAAKAASEAKAREESARIAREKAEEERREREAAEAKAREERAVAAALAEEKRKADEAHRAELAKIESEKRALEKAEADRVAELKRTQDEEAKRQKNRAHRAAIMGETKVALMTCGADEETAKKIVLAIVGGEIPNVTLRF